jgi:DtxR family Mn-dependent transcriptional regulator
MQTHSEENYLKTIFNLSNAAMNKVNVKSIADALGNNPASVIDMLKKLKEKKLIEYDKSKGAKLTNSGLNTALLIVRKHRLWEVFLKEKLNYSWAEVHEIAEQLEHIKHQDLADRLDQFLGFPEYDPHGDPIPKANGQVAEAFKKALSDCETGMQCRVVAVKDTSASFLQYLQHLNIGIGTQIRVVERIAFDDSLMIEILPNSSASVSNKFAESLLVV